MVPLAFKIAKQAPINADREVRIGCREVFRESKLLNNLIPMIEDVLAAGEIEPPKPYTDAQPPAIPEPKSIGNYGHRNS